MVVLVVVRWEGVVFMNINDVLSPRSQLEKDFFVCVVSLLFFLIIIARMYN